MMHTILRAIVCCATFAAAAALPLDAHAERSVRCRTGKLIDVGMLVVEVIGLCGEPKSRTVEEQPVFRRNQRNGTVAPTGEVTRTERWIYDRGWGQFDALLTFENGKLERIEYLTPGTDF